MKVTINSSGHQPVSYDHNQGGFQPWTYTPCFRCGVCCTKWQPMLDKQELEVIARGIDMPEKAFRKEYIQLYPFREDAYLLARRNGACAFLQPDGWQANCSIHTLRPNACRIWKPHLSRRECQEGLKKLKPSGALALPAELYTSSKELAAFCSGLVKITTSEDMI
jgi:Fe-S-cluster containining protein